MNKLIFPLFAGLLFANCKETPKPETKEPAATMTMTTVAPAAASPAEVQQAAASLATGVKMIDELRAQIDALPAKIKKAKAKDIDAMYATLEGMKEKQSAMLNDIKSAASPGGAATATQESSSAGAGFNTAQVKDFNESAASYAKEAQAMQETIAGWK